MRQSVIAVTAGSSTSAASLSPGTRRFVQRRLCSNMAAWGLNLRANKACAMIPLRHLWLAVLVAGVLRPPTRLVHADCTRTGRGFNRAVDAGREREAQQLVDRIAHRCRNAARFQVAAQRRLAAFRLAAVQSLMARGRPSGDYDRLMTEAERPEVLWQASATLGEVRFGERRFVDAAMAFDRAIEIMKNETRTPDRAFEIRDRRPGRSGRAGAPARRELVSGRGAGGFVRTARDQRDGKLGGIYSPSVRGIVPRAIPVPITFEYAKTSFTSVGEEAARELLSAIKEQQPGPDHAGRTHRRARLGRDQHEAVARARRSGGCVPARERHRRRRRDRSARARTSRSA